jgi:microcystin degradation protein MlrC
MARIAIAGFQHETNTFALTPADFSAFEQADGWPALSRGGAIFDAVTGLNLPVTGFIESMRGAGHSLAPIVWCSATPSAAVTKDAFERITAILCDGLQATRPLDAVYLDLHGAMVTEDREDGEGEILRRVREVVGNDIPVVASLDLHANLTDAMMSRASGLVAYRTYPHLDMAATGERAARLVSEVLARGSSPFRAMTKLPFLIPTTSQCTLFEPSRSIYRRLDDLERGAVVSMSFMPGFPPADIADCGPAVVAYGWDEDAVVEAARRLYEDILKREKSFKLETYGADAAVERALAKHRSKPVVLADTQDNPGGGADSDSVWLLKSLVKHAAEDAVVATICDPETAGQAHEAGVGATISARLGGKSGLEGHKPYAGRFIVEKVTEGIFTGTGPMWRGARIRLGRMALLRVAGPKGAGVRVIVSSRKLQAADQSVFRHMGIDPAEQRILALKSSVHFRADFQDMAAEVLIVETPGPNAADPAKLAYKRLRNGIRLGPLGKPFKRPE